MTKDVHVSAYTKKDGTHVDAYDRARPGEGSPSEENGQNLTLEGGVTMNNYLGPELSNKDYLRGGKHYEKDMEQVAELRSQLDVTSWFTYKDSKKLLKELTNSTGVINHKTIEKNLNRLKESQETLHTVHKNHLERLIASESQAEYEKLYKIYVAEEKHIKETDYNIKVMEYYLENKNYAGLKSEVEKYHKTSEKHHTKWKTLNDPKRYILHDHPNVQTALIEAGMIKKDIFDNSYDAKKGWEYSRFKTGEKYIKKNGIALSSISQLNPDLQKMLQPKIKKQLNRDDCAGIVYHQDSSISKTVAESVEFNLCVKKNLKKLLSGSVIKKDSINFTNDENTHLFLGHADVIEMYIDNHNNLNAYIIDTYDFNEDDLDWKVEWAHNLQDQGYLENYFTVTIISVPFKEWTSSLSKLFTNKTKNK